jgi:hypothetical protein
VVQGKIWRLLKEIYSNVEATSSTYIRAFIILDEKETPMFSFSNKSERSFIKIENRAGERIHPV